MRWANDTIVRALTYTALFLRGSVRTADFAVPPSSPPSAVGKPRDQESLS